MPLSITLGQPVNYVIDGHSTSNGAAMPAGSTIALTSTDPTVADPGTLPPLAADQKEIVVPVSPLKAGTCDWSGTVTTPDGKTFAIAADTLTVAEAAPTLDHVTGTFMAG